MTVTNRRLHFMQLLPMTWHKIVQMDAPVMVNACWVIANAIQALVAMIVAKVSGFSIFSHAPATSNKTKKNPLGNAIFAALFRSLCETICKLKRKITAKKDLINVLISLRKTQKESEGDFRALSHSYMVCVWVWHPKSINRKCSMNRE